MSKNLSAIKRVQVSQRNNLRNKYYKSNIKTIIKKTLKSIDTLNNGNEKEVEKNLSIAYSKIDKAVSKGVIKKNKGARQKATLVKQLKKNNSY